MKYQGQYNAAALTAFANGGKDGARSYIRLSVPQKFRKGAGSAVLAMIGKVARLQEREQDKQAQINKRERYGKLAA